MTLKQLFHAIVISSLFATSAFAEPPRAADAEAQLAEKVATKKSDEAYGRLLLRTLTLAAKYKSVANSDAVKEELTTLQSVGSTSLKVGQSLMTTQSASVGLLGVSLLSSLSLGGSRELTHAQVRALKG